MNPWLHMAGDYVRAAAGSAARLAVLLVGHPVLRAD